MEQKSENGSLSSTTCSTACNWSDDAIRCAFDSAPLSDASKLTYKATMSMLVRCHASARSQDQSAGETAPDTLCQWLAMPSCAFPAIQRQYPALRTQQGSVKTTLALFKYSVACGKECLVSQNHSGACSAAWGDAHSAWHLILRHLDQQVRAEVATSERSVREVAGWIGMKDVREAEVLLRAERGMRAIA